MMVPSWFVCILYSFCKLPHRNVPIILYLKCNLFNFYSAQEKKKKKKNQGTEERLTWKNKPNILAIDQLL